MSASDPVVIVGMARTPMGAMLGELAGFSANELGAHAIKAAMGAEGGSCKACHDDFRAEK